MSSVPFMDVYTPCAHRPGAEGTVLCSVALGNFPTPAGPVSSTQSGHGNWIRVAKNTYAFTVWRLRVNLTTGMTVGWAKFCGP